MAERLEKIWALRGCARVAVGVYSCVERLWSARLGVLEVTGFRI